MITLWDYVDTELPCTEIDRSVHMKDMGSMGWELISVVANPENDSHVYFWKRPRGDDLAQELGIDNQKDKKRLQELQTVAGEKVQVNEGAITHPHNFIQKIPVSNYDKFPEPQVVMVVKYRTQHGCFEEFREELYKRDYPNCIARHMGFNKKKEFVCVSLMESIDAALDLEGVGTNWLDSVDDLLIKYPNGSRTESFSGPVWGWHPNYENLRKSGNKPKAFTVIVVKMKLPKLEETKDLILQPSTLPSRLFTCVAQYKDSTDTYIHVGLDILEGRIDADEYFQNDHNKQLDSLVIREESKEFFSGSEDFVWFNAKYLQE